MGKEVEFSPFPGKFSQPLSRPGSLRILPAEQGLLSALPTARSREVTLVLLTEGQQTQGSPAVWLDWSVDAGS